MDPRLNKLKRLAALYGSVEEMHAIALQRARAAVAEAEQAIHLQQGAMRSARFDSRDSLIAGDRLGWTFSEAQREIAGWNQERLEKIRLEREELSDAAREQYVARRLKSEQMKSVLNLAKGRELLVQGRRTQAAADDRFLSRSLWLDAHAQDRTAT